MMIFAKQVAVPQGHRQAITGSPTCCQRKRYRIVPVSGLTIEEEFQKSCELAVEECRRLSYVPTA